MEIEKTFWIIKRNDIVCGVFKNRQKAISFLKKLLKQTLKDLEDQDKKDCMLTYKIKIPKIEFEEIIERKEYLGL